MRHADDESFGGLSRQSATTAIDNRSGNEDRNTRVTALEECFDGKEGSLKVVERVHRTGSWSSVQKERLKPWNLQCQI